jgi:peptidoglycan/LPS O-acetylase OafA/YrhL
VFPIVPGYVIGTLITFPIVWGLLFVLLLPPVAARMAHFKTVDAFLGNLTYPLYTLHFPLNQMISYRLYTYLGPPTVFVQLAVSLAAAYVLWRYVDRPLTRVRAEVRQKEYGDTR